jgi:hypothetical protein
MKADILINGVAIDSKALGIFDNKFEKRWNKINTERPDLAQFVVVGKNIHP